MPMTLREAVDRIISDQAVRVAHSDQWHSSFALAVANACRALEDGNAHAAIIALAQAMPPARMATWERLTICGMHPAA